MERDYGVSEDANPHLVPKAVTASLAHLARTTDCTMLFVTHEMQFARESSNRMVMFDYGRIVESGPPERIFTAPESPRTQAFLKAVLKH